MNDVVKLPVKTTEDGTPFIDISKKYSKDGYVPDWQWMKDWCGIKKVDSLFSRIS